MAEDNVVLRFMNKMTDLFVLNLLFLICSIPIVTIGASLTAMYAVSLRSVRYGDGYVVKTFFKSFKECFWQATLAWILCLISGLLLYIDYNFWTQAQEEMGEIAGVMKVASLVVAIGLLIVFQWVFPVIAKMKDRFWRQVRNAAAMAVAYFIPYTLICLVISIGAGYLAYTNVAAMIVMLMVGFATVTYMQSFFIYRVFAKFIQETPASEDDFLYQQYDQDKAEPQEEEAFSGEDETEN